MNLFGTMLLFLSVFFRPSLQPLPRHIVVMWTFPYTVDSGLCAELSLPSQDNRDDRPGPKEMLEIK